MFDWILEASGNTVFNGLIFIFNKMFEITRNQMTKLAKLTMVSFDSRTGQEDYAGIWEIATNTAQNLLVPIAISIVVIFFLIAIAEKVMSESFTLELFIREVLKLCAGLFLVTNSIPIIVGLIELGNGILSKVVLGSFEISPNYTPMKPGAMGISTFIPGIILGLLLMFLMLCSMLLATIMRVVCIIRLLEIALRTATSPLALADTFSGNLLNSHAINFMRSFGALCLQGIFIALIASFVPGFWASTFVVEEAIDVWGWFGSLLEFLVVEVACLILMFKANSISREMLGAR